MSKNVAQPDTIAHYQLRSLLGSGGMGEVYLAHDSRLDRPVALKLLRASDGSAILEARAASALNHPNVAHIYEVGQLDGGVYIAMEYVEGVTLEARLERGPLPIDEAVRIALQLLDALGEAQVKGLVHRDLKPGNIVINPRGQAKILDFGIAKFTRDATPDPASIAIGSGFTVTEPNTAVGTIPYMSPEQARANAVDPRSDL